MWYRWTSIEAFDLWHANVCATLGIPHPGRNAATGEVDESAQWTTAYTEAAQVVGDDWRAWVDDDVAAAHPDGLGAPSDPPPSPEITEP